MSAATFEVNHGRQFQTDNLQQRRMHGKQDALLRFFEAKFQIADRDQDGRLTIAELANFLRFVTHPDLRTLRS
jgi:hypothetical protein